MTVTISKEEYFKMFNELSNLRSDNERFKAERDVLMNNAKEIIAHFYCWYISSTFKRDLSRIEEGRDEAQQFLDDLVFEVSGVEKKMNNCDLCGKETFTEFTVKSKHLRWVLSEDLQKLDTHKNNWLTKNICEDCFKKIFGKPEENDEYELPEPFGEKHYRPFKDFNELMSITGTKLFWVVDKCCFNEFLITGNQNLAVYIFDRWYSMKELFDEYTFPDGTPCGILEK